MSQELLPCVIGIKHGNSVEYDCPACGHTHSRPGNRCAPYVTSCDQKKHATFIIKEILVEKPRASQ
jgi:hypothetical protein